ncbi:hypothetical protein C7D74_29075 [Klebsiella pneumoniae]|nr:hypothetical protein C7D74_29075 [Klebsiella pneumoniae]
MLAEVRNTPWNERHYYAVDGSRRARWRKPFTFRRLTRWTW